MKYEDIIELGNEGVRADLAGNDRLAAEKYSLCIRHLKMIHPRFQSSEARGKIEQFMKDYSRRLKIVSTRLATQKSESTGGSTSDAKTTDPEPEPPEKKQEVPGAKDFDFRGVPKTGWDDVIGIEAAKRAIYEAIIVPTKFPAILKGIKPWSGILLYGPPGTGKTMLANAAATAIGYRFFNVSMSDLFSKWVGESEQNLRSLFEQAEANAPSIVFIDEIDGLCSSRNTSDTETTRRVKNEMLSSMSALDGRSIVVIGATNRPWDLDDAALRRFQRKIYVRLPDENARYKMIVKHLEGILSSVSDSEIRRVARMTEGFSGSEIETMMNDAKMEPVRQVTEAKSFTVVSGHDGTLMFAPIDDSSRGGLVLPLTIDHIDQNLIQKRPVCMTDIERVFDEVKLLTTGDQIARFEQWSS